MKRFIILGAPGSGKGSQCKWITKDYNVPHIVIILTVFITEFEDAEPTNSNISASTPGAVMTQPNLKIAKSNKVYRSLRLNSGIFQALISVLNN